jgi:hypothetical protein
MNGYYDFTKELKFFVVLPQSIPHLRMSSIGVSPSIPSSISTRREKVVQTLQQKDSDYQALVDYDHLLSSKGIRSKNIPSPPLYVSYFPLPDDY